VVAGKVMVVFKPFNRPSVTVVTFNALQNKFLIFLHRLVAKKTIIYFRDKSFMNAMAF